MRSWKSFKKNYNHAVLAKDMDRNLKGKHQSRVYAKPLPQYDPDDSTNYAGIGKEMDALLIDNFEGKRVLLRCIDVRDHEKDREELIDTILKLGTDLYDEDRQSRGYDKDIDVCAYELKKPVEEYSSYFHNDLMFNNTNTVNQSILDSFFVYEGDIDGATNKRIDLVLVYDAEQLTNIPGYKDTRGVEGSRKDAFIFKDKDRKAEALLGILNFT